MSIFHASIITILPESFPGPLGYSLAGKALKKDIWSFDTINLQNFGITKHRKIDDTAYGGGNGLIMRPDTLSKAIEYAISAHPNATIYYPSPRGQILTQNSVKKIILQKNIVIICGRFEGIDERVIEEYNIQEISIGDYILSGGEIATLVILDAAIRLLPGVLNNQDTLLSESFEQVADIGGILEYPLYTKPYEWKGRKVPKVLLSGNHSLIMQWKRQQALDITRKRRPDLLKPS